MERDDTFLYQGGTVKDKRITNVVVKEGIQRIDDDAFKNCRALVSVSIPDSVTYTGSCAFQGCENLKRIVIPDGVKIIEKATFMGCGALESITLPKSITSIGGEAFEGCKSLKTIAIPKGLEEIGPGAFMKSWIEEFVIPNGIKSIPEQVFYQCRSLQLVELPSSVEEIGRAAFQGCYNLENFVLPHGLPKLTKLNLNSYRLGVHGFDLISQLIVSSPSLEELSLKHVGMKRTVESESKMLNDDDIPMLLQLVSLCPSLRTLNVSYNPFTPQVFQTLTSLEVPGHLRWLRMYQHNKLWRRGVNMSATHDLLRVLEANPKLGIWTCKFWPDSEDENVRHHLEMNKYGCRGFRVPNALWPLLIEKLAALEMEKEKKSWKDRKEIDTGAPNILYPLLCRHPELFLARHES